LVATGERVIFGGVLLIAVAADIGGFGGWGAASAGLHDVLIVFAAVAAQINLFDVH
jgi:uncharacterized membrane protein YtjA (UPF0391 family)